VTRTAATWHIAVAYAKAHGVTARGVLAYLGAWVAVAAASRFGVSALGLEMAEPGSTPMDTIAVLLMLVLVAIVSRCLTGRLPALEATRSRGPQPARLVWSAVVGLGAAVGPLLTMPLLHGAIDRMTFLAGWGVVLGLHLVLGAVLAGPFAMVGTFAVLAVFTTPSLLPWPANIIYNVDLRETSATIGAVLVGTGLLLLGLRGRSGASDAS
jgi:hypothetical protein